MAQVEVRFGAVIGHIDFSVLKRAHGAGIDIDIGIELQEGYFEAPALEKSSDGCSGQSFSQR